MSPSKWSPTAIMLALAAGCDLEPRYFIHSPPDGSSWEVGTEIPVDIEVRVRDPLLEGCELANTELAFLLDSVPLDVPSAAQNPDDQGTVLFNLTAPAVGSHSLRVRFAACGDWDASQRVGGEEVTFTVVESSEGTGPESMP